MSKAFEPVAMRRISADRVLVLEHGQPLEGIRGLGEQYDAIAYEYKGDWHLLAISELGRLGIDREPTFRADRLLGARTRVKTVPIGTRPTRAAIMVNSAGNVSGAWLAEPVVGKARKAQAKIAASGPLRGARSSRRRSRGGSISAEGASPDAPETNTISRTPHLDAPDEIAKQPGTEFTVQVYVDKEDLHVGETGEGIELDLPADVDSIEVKVLLQCVGPFELVEGTEFRRLTIARDEDESKKLEFRLRVIRIEEEPGPVAISALFNLRGRACGQVARSWDWAAPGDTAPAIKPEAEAPVSMPLYIDAEEPSLSIVITAPAGGTRYKCAVQAPALKGYEELSESQDFELPPNAAEFRKNLLKALTDESSTAEARFSALVKFGHEAWEAAPEMVKDVLWQMIDDPDVSLTTINIASVEPLLPWELMIPRRFDGKEPWSLRPLGVAFAIGRWTRGEVRPPSPYLKVDRSFVIAPTYPDPKELNYKDELDLIESKLHGERVTPATKGDLNERFSTDQASLLHFVCHGAAKKEDDAIALDEGELLYAGEMETLGGFVGLCQTHHPLVFLNSCSTGQQVPSLGGGAGFPRSFGNIGAKAIIAPLWSVDDKLASKIALELYREALKPDAKSLAAILQGIRQRGYEEEDADTYAAYCFFGDPQARLELTR